MGSSPFGESDGVLDIDGKWPDDVHQQLSDFRYRQRNQVAPFLQVRA